MLCGWKMSHREAYLQGGKVIRSMRLINFEAAINGTSIGRYFINWFFCTFSKVDNHEKYHNLIFKFQFKRNSTMLIFKNSF